MRPEPAAFRLHAPMPTCIRHRACFRTRRVSANCLVPACSALSGLERGAQAHPGRRFARPGLNYFALSGLWGGIFKHALRTGTDELLLAAGNSRQSLSVAQAVEPVIIGGCLCRISGLVRCLSLPLVLPCSPAVTMADLLRTTNCLSSFLYHFPPVSTNIPFMSNRSTRAWLTSRSPPPTSMSVRWLAP